MGKGTIRGRIELAIYPWSVKTDGSYEKFRAGNCLSLIHISEPTRRS